eukprot:CAMPEP_0195513114 /NCGR_PEP_ID=MMETSP0794_2-20130614/4839_1 /TAXON_ID=515487 /ORGANISM="Stephanopyxis turris, Strain CCMP 815" /LENGTH=1112 /DNA_ID=CAMNT_0040641045 /DNA_START=145 /DNA_END=3480 /DNA_ORIENTATION=-
MSVEEDTDKLDKLMEETLEKFTESTDPHFAVAHSKNSSASFEEAIENMLDEVVAEQTGVSNEMFRKLEEHMQTTDEEEPPPVPRRAARAAAPDQAKAASDQAQEASDQAQETSDQAQAASGSAETEVDEQATEGDDSEDSDEAAPPVPRRASRSEQAQQQSAKAAAETETAEEPVLEKKSVEQFRVESATTLTEALQETKEEMEKAGTKPKTKGSKKKFRAARKKSSAIAALQARIGLQDKGNLLKRVYLPIILSGNFDTQDVTQRHDILQLLLDDIENIPIGDLKKILFALMGKPMQVGSANDAADGSDQSEEQKEDARKFAETLQNIFAMDSSIDSVVTPGMIRSCNLVARGKHKSDMDAINENAPGAVPIGLTRAGADIYTKALAKYRVMTERDLMELCRRQGMSTKEGTVLQLAGRLAHAEAIAGRGSLDPEAAMYNAWTSAQTALYKQRKAELERSAGDIMDSRNVSYERLDEASNFRRELAALKQMPRCGLGPQWGKITKEGVFDIQLQGHDAKSYWVKLVDSKLLFYSLNKQVGAGTEVIPPGPDEIPTHTVNLRHLDSVVGALEASAPGLTLVRTVNNTTDAVKFVNMEANAAEEWKMAINENRFNCQQILDLTEKSNPFLLLLKESLNMVQIDDQPPSQMAVKLYDSELRLFTHTFSGDEVLVKSIPLKTIDNVAYGQGLKITASTTDENTGAETHTTISLLDMKAIDALPWKIIIDEHRKPEGAGVVDLGLGNDLVLKQDIFQIRVGNAVVPRMVQLYDSQLRMLPTRARADSGSSWGSQPSLSSVNDQQIIIDLDAIHTVRTSDGPGHALSLVMKDTRLLSGEVHFVDISLPDAIEWKAAINYNRFKGTALVEGQSSVREVARMLNNVPANFDACHCLDRVVVYSKRKKGHFTCVKDADDPQRKWIPGRFIHHDEIGYMKKIMLYATDDEARVAREEDNGYDAPVDSAGYGYSYDDADETIDMRLGFLTEAARLEAERRYINAQAQKARAILEHELSLPRGHRIVKMEAEFAKVAKNKKFQEARAALEVSDDDEDSIDSTDRDIQGVERQHAAEAIAVALQETEPCTPEELEQAKLSLINRLNQCVIRVCIQKFRKRYPVI